MQDAAVSVIPSILDQIPDKIVKEQLLPKVKSIYLTNKADAATSICILECNAKVRISYLIGFTKKMGCKLLTMMEKSEILDSVIPMLQEVKLGDITVLVRVLSKFL